MIALACSQMRFSVAGSFASARQKLLMNSVLRVARISSNTAFTAGIVAASASVSNFTVAILSLRQRCGADSKANATNEKPLDPRPASQAKDDDAGYAPH